MSFYGNGYAVLIQSVALANFLTLTSGWHSINATIFSWVTESGGCLARFRVTDVGIRMARQGDILPGGQDK